MKINAESSAQGDTERALGWGLGVQEQFFAMLNRLERLSFLL